MQKDMLRERGEKNEDEFSDALLTLIEVAAEMIRTIQIRKDERNCEVHDKCRVSKTVR